MRVSVLILMFTAVIVGCDKAKKADDKDHDHTGSHGGELMEIGSEAAHVEFVHNESAGTVKLYVTGPDAKTALSIDPPVLKLKTDAGPVNVTTEAIDGVDGKASTFSASHDALKTHPEGRITLKIDGKEYNPEIVHDHDH